MVIFMHNYISAVSVRVSVLGVLYSFCQLGTISVKDSLQTRVNI